MGGSRTIGALRFLIFLVAALESVQKFQGSRTLTPSIVAVSVMSRRSSRAHKPNPKFADPAAQAEDVALPLHPSTDPIDARLWSIPFLKRQKENNKQ